MQAKKSTYITTLKSISWFVLIAVFVGLSCLAFRVNDQQSCKRVRVLFRHDKNLGFLQSSDIYKEVANANPNWSHTTAQKIKANMIENHIRENDYVKDAQVYVDHHQNLNIYVEPKAPIARIHDGYDSYYLSENWDRMPTSTRFSSRCIQVSGAIDHILDPRSKKDSLIQHELKTILNYIDKNNGWKAVIDQLHFDSYGRLEMNLTFIEPSFKMGFVDGHFDKRMQKAYQFVKHASQHIDLNEYDQFNFTFSQQVIGTKKNQTTN